MKTSSGFCYGVRFALIGIGIILLDCPGVAQMQELSARIGDERHVGRIMEVVDQYYTEIDNGTRALTDEPRYKHWARWGYWASLHTDADGNYVDDPTFTRNALAEIGRLGQNRSSVGNWTPLGPNTVNSSVGTAIGIGRVDRITFHPTSANVFYLCTPTGGLLKTTNGGSSYTHLTDFLPTSSVSGLVISHDNVNKLYALTGDGDGGGFLTSAGYRQYSEGVFASYDGGANWYRTSPFPIMNEVTGYALIQDPGNADILLAATNEGIFRTANGGQSWTQVLTGRTYELKWAPGIGEDIVYASQSGKFFRSTNSGVSWTEILNFDVPLNGGRVALAISNAAPTRVYLFSGWSITDTVCDDAGTFGGIYVSSDYGVSFTQRANTPNIVTGCCDGTNGRSQQGYDLALAVSHSSISNIVTGGLRVWRSSNGGFTMVNAHPECSGGAGYVHVDVHDVEYNPVNGYVYACTDGGLSVSTDNGQNWSDLSTGIANSQIYRMGASEVDASHLMIGLQDNGIKSYVAGLIWEHEVGGDGYDVIYDHGQANSGYISSNSSLYRFTGNGTSVTNITPPSGLNMFPSLEVHRTDANIVLAGYTTMRRSIDGGANWTSLGISGSWAIASCETNASRFYAAGSASAFNPSNGNMYRSDDAGVNWTQISGNLGYPTSDIRMTDIEVRPTNSNHVWISFGGYSDGEKVFFSFNAGASWVNLSGSLPNVPINAIQVDASNNAYVATDIGVFYRPNGADWMPFWNKLPVVPVSDLTLHESDGLVRAATYGRGVWESATYSTCFVGAVLQGPVSGRRLFETSDFINSFSSIEGGANTNVILKAANQVFLGSGFIITKGNTLRAYTAPCGEYDLP